MDTIARLHKKIVQFRTRGDWISLFLKHKNAIIYCLFGCFLVN